MKILVTNPTGYVGRKVLTELLAPEFSVRVITPDPSRLPEHICAQVEVICGSTDDSATLCGALDDVDALFWCVPGTPLREANVRGYYERFGRAGCRAIRCAETSRVVTVSAAGNLSGWGAGPISALQAMEDILDQSGAQIRHLRSGWFMENFLEEARPIREHGVFSYPVPGHVAVPMTAAEDVADVALKWLVRPDWFGTRRVAVYGPEELSFDPSSAIFQRVLDKPVRYTEVSVDDYVRHMVRSGASVHHAHSLAAMFAAMARGIHRLENHTIQSTTSTTLGAWAKSELLPLVQTLGPPSEPDPVSACFVTAQPTSSLVAHAKVLPCFSVAPRMNESQRCDHRRPTPRTKGMVRLCRNKLSGRWAGEQI